jgi:(1->4)-alpha-D-glucan 1-alpha-D-glucosylmutase
MTLPSATYRLQFRNGMDFERATGLVPYLAGLGVSHLYASPLFQALPGSTHGYDVTDHGRFDSALGGIDGFLRLSQALKTHELGLVLDIVPNHMAASPENPWWRDVLRHGQTSNYAGHFDIDWSQPKLTVPILGQPFGEALAAGEFALKRDADGLIWHYFDHAFPLDPDTWPLALGDTAASLPDSTGYMDWLADNANSARLDAHLAALSRDAERMNHIHEAQPWRLVLWRAARDMLSYRRFFEIADLVGVRVEEPRVFDDVHGFLFDMVAAGHVDGIRVDHIDGLADPTGYLERLRQSLPQTVSIWVEKILARGESLPSDWAIAGTTGYEFTDAVARVLTNPAAIPALDRAYATFTGEDHDYPSMLAAAKRQVLARNLAAELEALVQLATEALSDDLSGRDWGPDSLRRAITALLCAMPVYRTYLRGKDSPVRESGLLAEVAEQARADRSLDDPSAVDLLVGCLDDREGIAADAFRIRFQQTSGALMAKAVEDTLFYRFSRLISANEVGGDPAEPASTSDAFHAEIARRAVEEPAGLSATSTHDTKRGEDARMRIAALSEAPQEWAAAVNVFDTLLGRKADVPSVDTETRWLFYQALLGGWTDTPSDDLTARISAFLLKAAREAQLHTSWVKPDADYESGLFAYAQAALSCRPLVDSFAAAVAGFIRIGERKSLVQLGLKLTLPGIPDIYQGTEFADLSFVDPDNRRTVDFDRRRRLVEGDEIERPGDFDDQKMTLLRFGLRLRRDYPDVFAGSYRPLRGLEANGRPLAFVREGQSTILFVSADLSGTSTAPDSPAAFEPPFPAQDWRLARSFPQNTIGATPADQDDGHLPGTAPLYIGLFEAT